MGLQVWVPGPLMEFSLPFAPFYKQVVALNVLQADMSFKGIINLQTIDNYVIYYA